MSSPRQVAPARPKDLTALLTARLRSEFAVPVILVDPADPVIGGPQCLVPACERLAVLLGKCTAHHQHWVEDGRPGDVEAWAATVPALRRWLQQPVKYAVETCRRGRREFGLCHSHASRWHGLGRPDLTRWTADGGGTPLPAGSTCRFPSCELDAEGAAGLCGHHRSRWIRGGRPPVESWLLTCETFGRDRFDLRALPMPMRLEVAYAIQCRVDERRTKTRPDTIRRLLRRLPGGGVDSLLDRSPDSWIGYLEFSSEPGSVERRFLLDAIGYLRDLVDGTGWDAEYPRDVWLLRRLGYPGRDNVLRFTGITPIWLRQLTKRWVRWRLSTGTSLTTVAEDCGRSPGSRGRSPRCSAGPRR